MKKQKIANYLKTGILLLGVSLFLQSCEKVEDFDRIQIQKKQNKAPYENLEYEQVIQQNDFNEILETVEIRKYFNSDVVSNTTLLKKGEKTPYFRVVKSTVKKIKKENYTSYTFLIERAYTYKEKRTFENLVIEKRKDSMKASIIKYVPSKEYLEGEDVPFSGKMSIQKIDYDPSYLSREQDPDCIVVISWVRTHCGNTAHGYNGYKINGCYNYEEGQQTNIVLS